MFGRVVRSLTTLHSCQKIASPYRTGFPTRTSKITTAAMDSTPYQLSFYVPKDHTSSVLTAVHHTGAGTFPGGLYGECAFISSGTGTFRPLQGAKPNIGNVGEVERVEEDKVELMCFGKSIVVQAVEALKKAHPYEQVAYLVVKGENV